VYTGMKRITLLVVVVLLAVPVAAMAKVGVEFQRDAADLNPGEKTHVSMMVLKEPGDGQPPRAEPKPVVGVRPLATFRNDRTGDVVRVRGSRTNRDGIAFATVAFPSRGDWSVSLTARGIEPTPYDHQQFTVGSRGGEAAVVETVAPPADAAATGTGGDGFPWTIVVVGLGALALLAMTARFGPRRVRALLPNWLGGGA